MPQTNEPDDLRSGKDHGRRPWAARADAVFVSGLQLRDEPSAGQVRQVVAEAIGALGCSGCAGRVAQEFGDHPETAVIRMRWARGVAREAFADPAPEPDPGADARAWPVIGPRLPADRASGWPGAGRRLAWAAVSEVAT